MGHERTSLVRRFTGLFRSRDAEPVASRYGRIEERYRSLSKAADQWLTLLQEMEAAGQTTDPRYETYYQAYLQAKQQQKRADLELFNLRQSLTS
jgi:hypothetical protein